MRERKLFYRIIMPRMATAHSYIHCYIFYSKPIIIVTAHIETLLATAHTYYIFYSKPHMLKYF